MMELKLNRGLALASGIVGWKLLARFGLVGDGLLVGLGRSVVLVLLGLVADGVAGGFEASADVGVVVLGNLLVGLLGSLVGSTLELVRDVVAGLLDGIHFGVWGWR
jgi:hypothetical protein